MQVPPAPSGGRRACSAPALTVLFAMATDRLLPQELCDNIIDELCDQPDTLKSCSLVSRSWTLRSQKHLFSVICFQSDADVFAWQNVFPDPCNSPAYYARILTVKGLDGSRKTTSLHFATSPICLYTCTPSMDAPFPSRSFTDFRRPSNPFTSRTRH